MSSDQLRLLLFACCEHMETAGFVSPKNNLSGHLPRLAARPMFEALICLYLEFFLTLPQAVDIAE